MFSAKHFLKRGERDQSTMGMFICFFTNLVEICESYLEMMLWSFKFVVAGPFSFPKVVGGFSFKAL